MDMYFAQLDFDLMLDKETLRQIVFGILEHCLIFVAEGCIFEVGTVRALNGAEAIGMIQTLGFPTIDLVKTGQNISRMRLERGMTVRDLQKYFGFEEPRAIYKWQRGGEYSKRG